MRDPSIAEIDLFLVMLFGIGFLHKSWIESDIARISARLTLPENRTLLGNTFRSKTRSLALFTGILGVAFILRGIPELEESRLLVLIIRASAFTAFLWNQYWCYRMREVLRERLDMLISGHPVDSKEGML